MTFTSVVKDPSNIYERIVKQVTSLIIKGQLKPGDKLPAERTLAELLGVSRTSIREALKMLAAQGLVVIKHGQGVFITDQNPEEYLKNFSQRIFLEHHALKDLYEMRKMLETQAAFWAATRKKEEQLEEIEKLITTAKEKIECLNEESIMDMTEHDTKFHGLIAEMSDNKVLVKIMHDLLEMIEETRTSVFNIPGRAKKSLMDHIDIYIAIKNGQGETASQAMRLHLIGVEDDILKQIETQERP